MSGAMAGATSVAVTYPLDLVRARMAVQQLEPNVSNQKISVSSTIRAIVKEDGYKAEYSGDNSRYVNEFGKYKYTDYKEAISELFTWYSSSNNVNIDVNDLL